MVKEIHFKNMIAMKKLIVILSLCLCAGIAFSQISLTIEITGVKKNGGKLYISLFNCGQSFDERKIYYSTSTNATEETVCIPIALLAGEYVISMYQDWNGNAKLDSNFLGIPKEPFGFSNYRGKSAPGNFDKLKVMVNDKIKKITVHLYKI
jgi:uncharacterized protein (DUF2141 family)